MKDYYEAEEVAKLWDVSMRQAQYLCKHWRVDGATKWMLMGDSQKCQETHAHSAGKAGAQAENKRGRAT